MDLALWIVAIVLAVAFVGSGLMKLALPKDKLVANGQGWAQDVTPANIRLIGVAEVLGAAGLILPPIVHVAAVLVPLAAVGLVFVMGGAVVVHARRGEAINIVVNVVLLALAVFVAWGRFGPYPFAAS
jgi:uncharacterized membrane protein YphA (DoxX/SURF4 family)